MEFLTPQQKKDKARRLFLGYGLLSVLVVLATYILISTALGWEVISLKGGAVQNGLLFVNSRPSNADIYINGKKESAGTDAKLSLPEGSYNVSLKKSGYNEWRDTVNLSGGAVKFITYPRLMPTAPKKIADIPYQSGALMSLQSRDKRWLAVSLGLTDPLAQIYDLDNPNTPPTELTIPAAMLAGKTAKAKEILEWAGDNHRLLVRVTIDGTDMVYEFDRDDPANPTDLTTMFGLIASDHVGLWDAKWDKIYIHHQGGIVQLGSIKDRSIGATPIISDSVLEFLPMGGEHAVYTVAKLGSEEQSVKYLSGGKAYIFTTIKKSEKPLLMRSAGFNRNDYIALGGASLEKTLLFKNLISQIKEDTDNKVAPFVTLPLKASSVEFSRSNRFLLVTDGSSNALYDIEQKEPYKYKIPAVLPATTGWFDDARLFSLGADASLWVYDFNGTNSLKFATDVSGTPYVNADVTHATYNVTTATNQVLRSADIANSSK